MLQINVLMCYNIFSIMIILSPVVLGDIESNETSEASLLETVSSYRIEVLPHSVNKLVDTKENTTVEIYEIIEPSNENHSANEQVGITVLPPTSTTLNSSAHHEQKAPHLLMADFKPSQQINTYYERNEFPVVPAFAEAKQIPGININSNIAKPIRSESTDWWDRPIINNFLTTTQKSWYSNNINYQTSTENPLLASNNHPYPFVKSGNTFGKPEIYSTTPYSILTNTITRSSVSFGNNDYYNSKSTNIPSTVSSSDFNGYGQGSSDAAVNSKNGDFYKTHFLQQESSLGGLPTQKLQYEQPHLKPYATAVSPWKKIFKFFTTLIPIGLLLSALTPTVINISPMNGTQLRGRAEKEEYETKKLLTSLKYINKLNAAGCEDRVICELLIGAGSSSNAEQHIENILENFTDQERDVIQQIEELNKIFKAVKSGDCSSLICISMSPTQDKQ